MNTKERLAHLAFNQFLPFGPQSLKRIQKCFPSLEEAFRAPAGELRATGLREAVIAAFCSWRKDFSLPAVLDGLARENINFLTWDEPEYPALLREIYAPPAVLYYRGEWPLAGDALAVVGPRQPSPYARLAINHLLPPVIAADITIISGLALGVDTLAHRAALSSKGRTLAVLGSGLKADDLYPRENRRLAEDLVATGGTIISEFPPGTPPYRQNFPRRNRLIAGLSRAVLVIEAAERSGALITARYALEQGREVLAVPGNIFSAVSYGTNRLIKDGATPATSSEDILEIFGREIAEAAPRTDAENDLKNDLEKRIYRLIRTANENASGLTADEMIEQTELDTATVNSTLSILEIKGLIKRSVSGYSLN